MVQKSLALVGVALVLHGFAQAAHAGSATAASGAAKLPVDPPSSAWAAQGQLGFLMARGNTSTNSGNASFDAAHLTGRWTLSGGFAALYASTAHVTTEQDLNGRFQADLELSPRTFWFGTARYDRNLFSGFAYQESVASGAGFNFVQTPATQLSAELGVGWRREEPELLVKDGLGTIVSRTREPVVNDAVLHAALKFEHSITATTKVMNTVLVEAGSSDTLTTDNLSLQVKVDESLALSLGMQLRNNTNPPPGAAKHTDTVMTVNLVYALKNSKLSPTATTPLLSDLNLLSNLP